METVSDFHNKLCKEIASTYFPAVAYYRDDVNCTAVHRNVELFNNGCLHFKNLINELSRACNEEWRVIEAIVHKYMVQKFPKTYYTMYNVGKSKYVIKCNNGFDEHQDGSQFFDVSIFSNKKKFEAKIKELKQQGYVSKY